MMGAIATTGLGRGGKAAIPDTIELESIWQLMLGGIRCSLQLKELRKYGPYD